MTDDSPWQDLKDARDGVNKAAKSVDDFATHSTSRVIGPLATRALEASKRAMKRWFSPEPAAHPRPRPVQAPVNSGWSLGGAFLKMLGHDPAKEGVVIDDELAPEPISPEPSSDEVVDV